MLPRQHCSGMQLSLACNSYRQLIAAHIAGTRLVEKSSQWLFVGNTRHYRTLKLLQGGGMQRGVDHEIEDQPVYSHTNIRGAATAELICYALIIFLVKVDPFKRTSSQTSLSLVRRKGSHSSLYKGVRVVKPQQRDRLFRPNTRSLFSK